MGKLKKNFTRNNKEFITKSIPKGLEKMLDSQAPEGYRYIPIEGEKSIFTLVPKSDNKLNFSLSNIKLPKEIDGLEVTPDNIFDVLYVTQTPFNISETELKIDGKSYGSPSDVFVKNIISKNKSESLLTPFVFPEIKTPIKVKIKDKILNFQVKRVAYPSLTDIKLVNTNYNFIDLELLVSNQGGKRSEVTGNISLCLEKLETIDEVLMNKDIIKGISNNEISLVDFENRKTSNTKKKNTKTSIDALLNFYKKLQELEKVLGIKFYNETTFNNKTAIFTKQLYASLINESFYKMSINMNASHNFIGTNVPKIMYDSMKNETGLAFYTVSEQIQQFFGQTIHYYLISIYLNICILSVDDSENESKIEFKFLEDGKAFQKITLKEPEEPMSPSELNEFLSTNNIIDIDDFKW